MTAAALTVVGGLAALGAVCAYMLDRAGTAVAAGAVSAPQPVPVRHVGATEAGLQLAPPAEQLDPFDPRWTPPCGYEPARLFAETVMARAGLSQVPMGDETREFVLAGVR